MASEQRIAGRVERILAARVVAARKLVAIPQPAAVVASGLDDLEVAAAVASGKLRTRNLERKIAQFDRSLANFQKFGSEAPPTDNPVSVDIDVPKGSFNIKSHAPEG
jgi:hypothetical protein